MSGRTGEELEVNNIYFVSPTNPSAQPVAANALGRRSICIPARSQYLFKVSFIFPSRSSSQGEQKKKQMAKKEKLVNIDEGSDGAGVSDNKKEPLALILTIRGEVDFLFFEIESGRLRR